MSTALVRSKTHVRPLDLIPSVSGIPDSTILTTVAVAAFLEQKALTLSKTTVFYYGYRLKRFAAFFPWLPLDPQMIERFVREIRGSDHHRANMHRAVRTMYNWLERQRRLKPEDNPFNYVEKVRIRKVIPRVFTDEEMWAIIDAATEGSEKAMCLVLFDAGPRIGELVGCSKADIMTNGLRVKGKTGPRLVVLLTETLEYLRQLPHFYLFPAKDKHGRYFNNPPAHVNTLKNRFVDIAKRAGITGRRHGPHTCRHTAAVNILLSSGDLFAVMRTLGHARVATTQEYLSLADKQLYEHHLKHSKLTAYYQAKAVQS